METHRYTLDALERFVLPALLAWHSECSEDHYKRYWLKGKKAYEALVVVRHTLINHGYRVGPWPKARRFDDV